jgi:hypothetical protein
MRDILWIADTRVTDSGSLSSLSIKPLPYHGRYPVAIAKKAIDFRIGRFGLIVSQIFPIDGTILTVKIASGIRIRNMAGVAILPAMTLLLSITACSPYHVIHEEDALYCEKQGFPPGTDANVHCAIEHEAAQEDAGVVRPPPDPATLKPMPVEPPEPPPHPEGGIPQVTPITAPIGVSSAVNFSVSVNPDCSVNGLPTVRVTKKPEHGTVQVFERTDYARFSAQTRLLPACGTKRLPGMVVAYTPGKYYIGDDFLEFETITKTGIDTIYKVPITVERLAPQKPIGF